LEPAETLDLKHAFNAVAKRRVHTNTQYQLRDIEHSKRVKAHAKEEHLGRIRHHARMKLKAARRKHDSVQLILLSVKVKIDVAIREYDNRKHDSKQ
jgi:hypothetical protein